MRIGLVADTHDEVVPWDQVHDKIADAFVGVELILHCGDLQTMGVLDRLEEIAPVLAVRSEGDPPPAPPRLVDGPRVVDAGRTSIGLVSRLAGPPEKVFDRSVGVVVHGGTHEGSIESIDGILLVNPGSPTLADDVSVAILEVGENTSAVLVHLAP